MLYTLAHILRDKCPFLWDAANAVNSWLFCLRFGKKLKKFCFPSDVIPISEIETSILESFFASQPEEAFKYFRPHGFDFSSLKKLQANKSFLAYVVVDPQGRISAYFFLRCGFNGTAYTGRMVDMNKRGCGLGKYANKVSFQIAQHLGLRVYETISPENIASLKSAQSENTLKIIKTMPNGDLFIEKLPKE